MAKEGERGVGGISLLPGSGPGQQPETRLRVPGEDDVLGRAKDPVAQHHLQIKGKLRGDPEESPGAGAGCPLVDNHEGVRVEDHQGEEVATEVFSQSWLTSESISRSHRVTVVIVD